MSDVLVGLAFAVITGIVVACFVYLRRTTGSAPHRRGERVESTPVSDHPGLAEVSVQGPDFSIEPHGFLDLSQTAELFRKLPWGEYYEELERRESSGIEGCPPNLSVVVSDGKRLFQVVCQGADHFWLSVDSARTRHELDGLGRREVEDVLEKHFAPGGADVDRAVGALQSS